MTCRGHLWKGKASSSQFLGTGAARVGAAARVLQVSPVPNAKSCEILLSPLCLLVMSLSCDCCGVKAPGQFSPGCTESVALEECGIFSERENKAPSMHANQMIIKRKLEGARTRKAPLCSVGPPVCFHRTSADLSARSLIEALNLASPRREGNRGPR